MFIIVSYTHWGPSWWVCSRWEYNLQNTPVDKCIMIVKWLKVIPSMPGSTPTRQRSASNGLADHTKFVIFPVLARMIPLESTNLWVKVSSLHLKNNLNFNDQYLLMRIVLRLMRWSIMMKCRLSGTLVGMFVWYFRVRWWVSAIEDRR